MLRHRLSSFVHVFKNGDMYALFHSLRIKTLFVDQEAMLLIEQSKGSAAEVISTDLGKLLLGEGFLTIETSEAEFGEIVGAQNYGTPNIGILYLILTDDCNLRCRYCFVENSLPENHLSDSMSGQTAHEAIDMFFRVSNPKVQRTIIFYGGEPLLNWEVMHDALHYIEDRYPGSGVVLNLINNGTLMTAEIAQELKIHGVSVGVSLDGPKKVHDKNRIDQSGQGTFELAEQGIRLLKSAGVPMGISCTLTADNVTEIEDSFSWILETYEPDSIGLNMLIANKDEEIPEHYYDAASKGIINCFQISREKGVREDRAMRKVEAFVGQKLYPQDCGGCGGQLVVTPSGLVGPCHGFLGDGRYFSDELENLAFNPLTHDTYCEWAKRTPLNMPECFDCPALGICGGGCPRNAHVRTGSIWNIDEAFCKHAKSMLEWMIWDAYRLSKSTNTGLG